MEIEWHALITGRSMPNDWRNAMRSAQTGVAAYYDMINDRLAGAPPASFEIPGDYGPAGGPASGPAGGSRGLPDRLRSGGDRGGRAHGGSSLQ